MKKYHDLFMKELWIKIKEKSLNKTRKITLLSGFLVFLTFVLFLRCNPVVKTIGPFSSPNAEESKKRGVFLWEYYPTTTKVYDTIDFEIKEVFAEKQYKYYSYDDLRYKISDDKTQLKIVAKRKLSELRYFELWVVENFDWSAHPYGLVRNYNSGYPPDSLLVNLILVDINDSTGRAGINDKKVIGSFMLRRK